jgi:phosphopantothenoylcysteine synthetase/decarboxylase
MAFRRWPVFMNILVTAGNTLVPIDRVRAITNIFTGRTGTRIALHGHERGHKVTLLTSHPEVVADLCGAKTPSAERWSVQPYRTFEDLETSMKRALLGERLNVLIHCAAVSDYQVSGIFAPDVGTCFDPQAGQWLTTQPAPTLVDRAASKVKSDEPELWLRLGRTPKLIDFVRTEWSFAGILVKFKLEVGIDEEALLEIAERSRQASDADLMVANTLEGSQEWALLGPIEGRYMRVAREELPGRLLDAVERLHREGKHG